MTILQKPIRIIDKICEPPPVNCEPPPVCKPCPPPANCEREKPDNCEPEKVSWKDKGDTYEREGNFDKGDKWVSKGDNYGREEKGEKYAKNGDDCAPGKEPVCKPKCEEEEPCKQVCEEDNECDVTAALACLPACGDVDYASDHLNSGAPFDTANFDTPDTYDLAA